MSRFITTLVQIILFLGVLFCFRLMWQDLKDELAEIKNYLINRK